MQELPVEYPIAPGVVVPPPSDGTPVGLFPGVPLVISPVVTESH